MPRVAVTGLGIVSALGAGARATFERLCAGERGIRPLCAFDASGLATALAAEVPLDLAGDRGDALASLAAREAVGEARWSPGVGRLGLALGSTAIGMPETEAELLAASASDPVWPRARRMLTHPLSCSELTLAHAFGPFVETASVCSACSSGALALALGAQWILAGRCEAVLAGGVDPLCRMTYAGFHSLGVLSSEACRPFDTERRGLTLGEGAGFVFLESEESAQKRGARVLAWLSGWAVGAEAHHVTQPEEGGTRAALLMQAAVAGSGLDLAAIGYVNAHGTGTPANDAMEARAIERVFGANVASVAVSSCKGQLGHTLGAAGAIEAAVCVLALETGQVPPTGGLVRPESAGLDHVTGSARTLKLQAALSNSFGFGGMDAVLLFEAAANGARPSLPSERSLVVSALATFDELPPGDPRDAIASERSRRFDRATASAAWLSQLVLERAGLDPQGVGLVLGGAYGPVERSLRFLDRILSRGLRAAAPAEFPQLVKSACAGNVSIYLGARGPTFSVSALEACGEATFALACDTVELGLCDAALAVALETSDAVVNELWRAARADAPARREGGACLLVEDEASAQQRGRVALARIERVELAALTAPRDPARAAVVTGRDVELIASGWAAAARFALDGEGYHEALGAEALARAVALITEGYDEVLVVAARSVRLSRVEAS